ncbi:hypothetical protein [Streptomyces sp. NPDC058745]|uniref:hypothetical protein n=1 Tax=Streptomyces sp. NPDC058745 TaxID=3346621 RepID=UPI0036C98DDB
MHRTGGEGRPAVTVDCTPRSGPSREDLEILDRWMPLAEEPGPADCGGAGCRAAERLAGQLAVAAQGKGGRLRHVARTLHESWLRPHGVRLREEAGRLTFSHPDLGRTELVLCPMHTLHTDVWDTCVRLRELTARNGPAPPGC